MTERSPLNPIPEGQEAYNPIGNFSFGSMAWDYRLVACRRCGAAVQNEDSYRDQHDTFHLAIDKLYEWAQIQENQQ